ncbi:MAG: hypothetical protein DME06_13170, partial [Candidatus Rokuibacteriota bacterium]
MSVVLRTGRALRRLVQVATARPALTVVVSLLLAAAGVVYSLRELTFITSGKDLLPRGGAYLQRYAEDSREFADPDQIVVAVQAPRLALAKAYASQVAHELRKYPDRFERVAYRTDPKQFEGRALLYASTAKLRDIRDKILEHQSFVESFAARPTLDQLVENISTQIGGAIVT